MIRDITLGQYYQSDSVLHKMDPRFKIIATLVFIVSLFLFTNIYVYIAAFIFMIFFIVLSKVPFKHILKGLKPIMAILIMTVFFNMFLGTGTEIFRFYFLKVTKEGLVNAIFMAVRLMMLVMGSSIMTFTTTPSSLTDGLEKLLGPLKLFKVPVHEIAMMMTIALRFIPILLEETDKIMKAQLARGADFETGNLIKKTKNLIPILIPLFISAFRRAADLAMAMEARCYRGGEGRTKMCPLKYKSADYIGYLVVLGYLGVIIIIGINYAMLNSVIFSYIKSVM